MTHPTKPTVPATFEEWLQREYPCCTAKFKTHAQLGWTAATAAQSEKLRVAVEALEFYAKKRNYQGANQGIEQAGDEDRGGGFRLDVVFDHGNKAREALAKLKESNDR